jgi:hypothetical protein
VFPMPRNLLILCTLLGCISAGPVTARSHDAPRTTQVSYKAIPMPACCDALLSLGPVVIESTKDLHLGLRWFSPPCEGLDAPHIDFSKYTLIGQWLNLGNCPAGRGYDVSVVRDDAAREYRHHTVARSMPCRGVSRKALWILVPKLPDGYTVRFESTSR